MVSINVDTQGLWEYVQGKVLEKLQNTISNEISFMLTEAEIEWGDEDTYFFKYLSTTIEIVDDHIEIIYSFNEYANDPELIRESDLDEDWDEFQEFIEEHTQSMIDTLQVDIPDITAEETSQFCSA